MVRRELRQVLVDIDDDGYGDDEDDGVEVGAYELVDDVPVHTLDEAERVKPFHPRQALPRYFAPQAPYRP